jgi:hypothetical protein
MPLVKDIEAAVRKNDFFAEKFPAGKLGPE